MAGLSNGGSKLRQELQRLSRTRYLRFDTRAREPMAESLRTSSSAAPSSATATAASTSRVNRGSTQAETANPPTSAQRTPHAFRSATALRSLCSAAFTEALALAVPPSRLPRRLGDPPLWASTICSISSLAASGRSLRRR